MENLAGQPITDLESLYASRFAEAGDAHRDEIWQEICRYLQRYVDSSSPVLDVACDRGDFIRNIDAAEKWAVDVRDVGRALSSDVRFIQCDGRSIDGFLPKSHFGTVFMSNYLEHLQTAEDILQQLHAAREVLRPGGRLIVLQPNIRLVGWKYWDFIDHHKPMTERNLREATEICGFVSERMITRFLPYTTKSRIPQSGWLVRAYLSFPPAWWVMGKQTLYVGRRPRITRSVEAVR